VKSPRTRRFACVTITLLSALTLGAPGRRALAQDSQPTETEKLVADLGADDFKRRDEAQRRLEAMGKKALPALEAAEKDSKDAEVRARAHEAIQSIRKGGPSAPAPDTERQGVPKNDTPPPFVPFPRVNPGPNGNGGGEDEGADIDEFFKLFEKGGANPLQGGDIGKIFEQLRKQLEGFDQEYEKELQRPNGQPGGRGKMKVYQFGSRPKTALEDKLGVALNAPSPAVRAQLDLGPTEAGLSIDELVPGSPAWKAGLKLYDVVTALDGKPVRTANDLAGLGERESKLEVIRKSKKEILLVHKVGAAPPETPAPPAQPEKKPEDRVRKF
jgi:hypothetical protein